MQDDRSEIFDRQIREMLEGAEIKAPRRVWRAVSAATSGQRRSRYAYTALAFACISAALVVGALFLNRPQLEPDWQLAEVVEMQNGGAEGICVTEPAEEAANIEESVKSLRKSVAQIIVSNTESVVDKQVTETESPALQQTEEPEQTQASINKESSDEHHYTLGGADDPLREESLEARLKKERISLALNGTAGGNDSDLGSVISRVFHYADGAENTERLGLSENSNSSYSIPVSVGIGFKIPVSKRFAIGSGINYSFLQRTFTGTYISGLGAMPISGETKHNMQYIGVPLNLYYEPFDFKQFRFYTFAGAQAELCVSNRYYMPGQDVDFSTNVSGALFSANLGLGVEFKFNDIMGLYLDPGVRYYFKSSHPQSIRTARPLTVNFDIGLRFNL